MAITGKFTNVEIPESVKPGTQIPLTVNYEALNPGALYWSSCIMAKVTLAGAPPYPTKLVVITKEVAQTGGKWAMPGHKFNLGTMPNERVSIKLRLLGHDDAGHKWTTADWRD